MTTCASVARTHRVLRAGGALLGAAALAGSLAGCGAGWERPAPSTTVVTVTRGQPAPTPAPDPAPAAETSLEDLLAALEVPAGVQVVLSDGVHHASTPTTQQGPAWSTIKVPLAMAALDAGVIGADNAALRQAITLSDNDAAMQLWEALGAGPVAASAVGAIAEVGVPAERLRPEFSPFGQTQWPLEQQADFATTLPCRGGVVYDLMGQIDPSQSWGLGLIPGAHFKGGWGPDPDGTYLVRQFGTLPTAGGVLGVAIATRGSFAEGTQTLSTTASALQQALAATPVPAARDCHAPA
ncbi:hypothetical protein C1Y63_01270 [Corynebacterium sp. 13CS0277]|uniref:hypothetical protein n=1 Tax=Corynebacterium sp. 13CS0277 TaxID=2071994 RepID=UPI000D02E99B|nr:hypothetical protein [Corynebacterium sp. 13CS0277]PRQ12451.1 hypothetical protein C1Y63_01270 [Corynebacterium sp. 13CS0277]